MPHWRELLSRGQAIDLSIAEGKSENFFLSVLEDVSDESLLVAAPITRRGRLTLSRGQDVRVYFNRSRSRYCFPSRVLDQESTDARAVYIAPPEQLSRSERRMDVRVDAWMVPLEVTIPMRDDEDNWVKIPAKLWNISSSGLLMQADLPPGEWSRIILDIKLTEDRSPIVVEGKPVNSRLATGVRGQRRLTGVSFSRIEEKDRDQIQRFVFLQQLELRKKGLL